MVSREGLAPQEKAKGSLGAQKVHLPWLCCYPPPQARPQPRTQDSEVYLDRDNELWLYFLPGALEGEPRQAPSAWRESNAPDKVQVSLFCSSTESQRGREEGGRVLTPLVESHVPKAL